MKILIICSFSESLFLFRGDLIKRMLTLGHEIHTAAPELDQDIKTRDFLQSMGVHTYSIPMQRTGLNPLVDLTTLFSVWSCIKKIQPSHILAYTAKPVIYGMLAAKLEKIPTRVALITGLGYGFTEKPQGLRRLLRTILCFLYKKGLSVATTVIFQNRDDLQFLNQLGLVDISKCHIVNGSGVNLDYFYKSEIPMDDDSINFLLIARLLKDKGICEYVAAARTVRKHFPKTNFHLVGWVDANPAAIDIQEVNVWEEEGIITYHDRMGDVRPAIEKAHVYVLPSYREGIPRTVLEAMAMGRPVITTYAPGCRETVINGHNGFLVPVKAVSELEEAMEQFIIDPKLITKMGNRSRLIAENKFDVNKVNNAILQYMELSTNNTTSSEFSPPRNGNDLA